MTSYPRRSRKAFYGFSIPILNLGSEENICSPKEQAMPPAFGTCEPAAPDKDRDLSVFSGSFVEDSASPLVRKIVTTYLIPKRYFFSMLSFTACCLAVSYNANLSITIVSMVYHNPTNELVIDPLTNKSFHNPTEILPSDFLVSSNQLDWDAKVQGLALGAVYYGQLVTFIPGGRMAELYGGKRMLIICTLIASISTALLPITALWNPYAFVAARIAVGMGTGPIIPIVFYMLARWIPDHDRGFHASFIISGYGIGSFLAVIISGVLCSSTFWGGWPSVYYVGAFIGVVWCFVCFFFMYENPENHPSISEEELYHIYSGLGTNKKEKILSIPWKEMVFSVPLWALAIGFFGQFWLLGFFSTVHALYMGTVLNLPIKKNGLLSCLPHLLRAFATCLASYPADILLKRNMVSVGFVRKGATVINTVVSCGAFLGITYVGKEVVPTTILFVLGGVLGEFVTFGVCLAGVDIAPNLSGTVSGVLNIVGVFPFFMIPALTGWITNYENYLEQWRKVFYTTIALVSISTIIFMIFGDLSPQPWGVSKKRQSESEKGLKEQSSDEVHTEPKIYQGL